MDFLNQSTKIVTDDSLMETASHGSDDYPFRYYYENLSLYDFNCIDWHWHNELEFVYIESGTVFIHAGDDQFQLSAGDGIMINSKVLHRFTSSCDAVIPNFLFLPSFISPPGSLICSKYVEPVLSSSLDYILFHENIFWEKEALRIIKEIIKCQDKESCREISTSMLIKQLWILLCENTNFNHSENHLSSISRSRLQLMMQYIHNHYFENMSLDNIAAAANISKSSALHLFQDNIHITPVNYLINYRLKRAALLLENTEKKITTISSETGFNHADHFCRTFKKAYAITPSEYRNQHTQK